MIVTLTTERLRLRPLEPRDRAAMMAGLNDFGVNYWMMLTDYPYTEADADDWYAHSAGNPLRRVITRDDRLIGEIGVEKEAEAFTLGYWLAQDYWGQGYATEAARAFLEYLPSLGVDALTLNYHHLNQRSARIAAKLGFAITGARMTASAHGFDYREITTKRYLQP